MPSRRRIAGAVALVVAGVGAVLAIVVVLRGDDRAEPSPALAAALARQVPASAPFPGLTAAQLSVGGECLDLVVADDRAERIQGLRGVTDLGPYAGMLFVAEREEITRFTMEDTLIPLDIGFYDRDGAPVGMLTMTPCPPDAQDCPLYAPVAPFLFALETPSGELSAGALGGCG